ncbi:MAG: hypothetical protein ACRDB1_15515, partial [Microcoleaceae cyanobacterium]
MDKKRTDACTKLIKQLLMCPEGKEAEIINQSSDLVDEELVDMFKDLAIMFQQEGEQEKASFLLDMVEELEKYLDKVAEEEENQPNHSAEDYGNFLTAL